MIVLAFDRDWTVDLSPHPTFERIFTVLVLKLGNSVLLTGFRLTLNGQ
jgi:hypothetical protein